MNDPPEVVVAELVARFLEVRKSGRRESIDALLDEHGELSDRAGLRDQALRRISQCAHGPRGLGGSSARPSLESVGTDTHFLSDSASDSASEMPDLEDYYIIDAIGRGGMGVVYEAYQRSTGRRVAVKFLIAAAKSAETVRRRFEREVELIARLQHPNIVSVLGSGLHHGRYFYAMDFVEGKPLDETLPRGSVEPGAALTLIATVGDAVDYAHQRGVLHRDLKPSNVLFDGAGHPHIVDFGLAKAIEPRAGGSAGLTLSEPGQLLGTLAYMSPEQSRGLPDEVSVRSDVYSLGVMAYELLTGKLPCEVDGPLQVVLDRIANQPPPRPSSLRHGIDADVDAILLKALEKSPQSRYATAGEFAVDIRRFLAGEAISARRAGIGRRAARLVRRHRGVAVVSGIALAVIVLIMAGSFFRIIAERDRARQAEQAAHAEAERAGRVKNFLRETLGYADPDVAQRADVRFVDQLDHVAAQVDSAFNRYPLEEADVRHTLGHYYAQRACYDKAERELRRALEIRRAGFGERHPDTASTECELAAVLHAQDRYAEAEELYAAALEACRERFGDRHVMVAQILNDWAWLLKDRGQYDQAEPMYRQALAVRRELLGQNHADVAETLNDLAHLYYTLHDSAKAEPLFREALAIRQNAVGAEKSFVKIAASMASLGGVLTRLDRADEAEPLLREALDTRRRVLGDAHADTIVSMNELGLLLRDKGDYGEAEKLFREALDLRKAVHGPVHSKVAVSLVNLGLVAQAQGNYSEAESLYTEGLDICQDKLRLGDNESVAAILGHMANLYREMKDYERAEQYAFECLGVRLRLAGQGDQKPTAIGDSKYLLGRIRLERGDAQDAEPLLIDAVEIISQKRSPEHVMTARAKAALGACRLALGRPDEAEVDLLAAFSVLNARKPLPRQETMEVLRSIIELYETAGNSVEAGRYRALLPQKGEPAPMAPDRQEQHAE